MMLSLPLPQSSTNIRKATACTNGLNSVNSQPRPFERRSLYFNLVLANAASIRLLTSYGQSVPNNDMLNADQTYVNGSAGGDANRTNSRFYITETSLDSEARIMNVDSLAPLHVRLGNEHILLV